MAKRIVYLAYTKSDRFPVPELIRIYAKQSYQVAYNWLAEIAERHGLQAVPALLTSSNVVAQVHNPAHGQFWWLERHNVE